MDNDISHLYTKGGEEGDVCLFEGNGPDDIIEILKAIGIEAEWC